MSIKRDTVEARKAMPLASGVLDYFPDALLVVAEVSRIGNEQHHPGQPLHWDKSKSSDEADALMRHLIDRGTIDTDGVRHTAKVAWRALALLQREIDAEAAEPVLSGSGEWQTKTSIRDGTPSGRFVVDWTEAEAIVHALPDPVAENKLHGPPVYGMERFHWDGYGGRYICDECGVEDGSHLLECPFFV